MADEQLMNALGIPEAQRYQIRVRGQLGGTIRFAFPSLEIQRRDRDTVLKGAFVDQAALYGVLAEIEALGLELIEVRQLSRVDRDAQTP
jgi:hypothetical protein